MPQNPGRSIDVIAGNNGGTAMDCMHSARFCPIVLLLIVASGCSRESGERTESVAERAAGETMAVEDDGGTKSDIMPAAAFDNIAVKDDTRRTSNSFEEISPRDADTASEMITRYFPIRNMELEHFGVLSTYSHGVGSGTVRRPPPGNCCWELTRGETEESRLAIHFELLAAPESEYDIPLQVGIDRVVFIHLKRCVDGEQGVVPCDEFKIDGVEIVELFRRCDERAIWHWDLEERELLHWQRFKERELARTAASAESDGYNSTSDIELAGGVSTPTDSVSTIDAGDLSSPVPILRQLAFRRFIGKPLDEMVSELELSGPSLGPGLIYGSMRGRNSCWVSPQFPDNYIEIFYATRGEGSVVCSIRLLERDRR